MDHHQDNEKPEATLVASTKNTTIPESLSPQSQDGVLCRGKDDFFKHAHWSADGTTIITSSSSNNISSYVLPEDLLESREQPLQLQPQSNLALPEPTHVVASAPYFSLAAPYTQTLLVACRDHPIQLFSALPETPDSHLPSSPASRPPPISSYPLIKPQTEEYLTPTALIWPFPGTHFLTGTANLISYFDINQPFSGPIHRIPTIPSTRHLSKGSGVGMRGTVSALGAQPDGGGLIAAGTWTRNIGLYDFARGGECAATWSVAGAAEEIGGGGVLQTVWSPCGRYLVVNERKSRGLLVYDVREARLLGWLQGRRAETNQRLSCDVYTGTSEAGGFEVWAGTQDGTVMVWEGVGTQEGAVERSLEWKAHDSAIGSTVIHSGGSVVATCSGSWSLPEDDSTTGPQTSDDADLSVWSIRLGATGNDT